MTDSGNAWHHDSFHQILFSNDLTELSMFGCALCDRAVWIETPLPSSWFLRSEEGSVGMVLDFISRLLIFETKFLNRLQGIFHVLNHIFEMCRSAPMMRCPLIRNFRRFTQSVQDKGNSPIGDISHDRSAHIFWSSWRNASKIR